jgi:O-antigen ligase
LNAKSGGTWERILKQYRECLPDLAFYLLGLANITLLFGVAPSEIFFCAGLAALLFARRKMEAPAPAAILFLYAAWTLLALCFSPLGRSELQQSPVLALPQIKKFFVFLVLPVAYTAFRRSASHEKVLRLTFLASTAAALVALAEFGLFYQALHTLKGHFYSSYSSSRITGFMGHWQTFSGQQMLVLAMLLAFLLYGRKRPWWTWVAAGLIGLSLLLSFTRGAWVGMFAAAVFLLWPFGRRWILALPLALVLLFLVSPSIVRERVRSAVNLRSDSSNQSRVLMLRTGARMIAAHPLVGVGANAAQYYFAAYRPAGPLPNAWYGHLHNNYVQIAAERGLPGLALFLCFLLLPLRDLRRFAASLPAESRYIVHGVAAGIVAIMVSGAFEYNFSDSEVVMLLLFYIAHGYAAGKSVETAASPEMAAQAV